MPITLPAADDETRERFALRHYYDARRDVLAIEGVDYAGTVFRRLGLGPIGGVLRLQSREDGVLTVRRLRGLELHLTESEDEAIRAIEILRRLAGVDEGATLLAIAEALEKRLRTAEVAPA